MITGTLTETNKAASFLQLNVSLDCLNLTKCLTREGQLITRLQHYGRESYGALDRTQSQWKARQWSGIPAKKCLQEGGDKSKWQLSGRLCSVHKESVVTQVGTHKEGKKKVHVWYYHGTKCHLEVTRYITP